ncbi:hypothetical protein FRB90_003400 [Tulasnella sp. 427]|nr:hypothetical protein FRB90_003400 [Tulasnella sp. 427]
MALPQPNVGIVAAFHAQLHYLQNAVNQVLGLSESTIIARLGDDLDDFGRQLKNHQECFDSADLVQIETTVCSLQVQVQQTYQQAVDASHYGAPPVIYKLRTGKRGRPRLIIEDSFLHHAHPYRGASKLARYLKCGRTKVKQRLLDLGLDVPGDNPFAVQSTSVTALPHRATLMPNISEHYGPSITVRTNPLQAAGRPAIAWSEEELDEAVLRLRVLYPRAGVSMLEGMLDRLGFHVPREAISGALVRLDPTGRVFERIRIERRTYSVPGPNALWHHDGQHGLIRWLIVIHGFIDGYSRLITGLRASNNNRAATVLAVFLRAANVYRTPSRLHGDHGVENVLVAAWMEANKGARRGSYIWGRSVHNVRIERLWVDVTAQFGRKWADFFTLLEINHGLDVNNTRHLWLLHYLFLSDINADCAFFAEAWNRHKIKNKGQPARSPSDMFFFDMITNGLRGDLLPAEDLTTYGIDWEAMSASHSSNEGEVPNPSWVGQTGPPPNLNGVIVEPPADSGLLDLLDHPSSDGEATYSQFNAIRTRTVREVADVPNHLQLYSPTHPHLFNDPWGSEANLSPATGLLSSINDLSSVMFTTPLSFVQMESQQPEAFPIQLMGSLDHAWTLGHHPSVADFPSHGYDELGLSGGVVWDQVLSGGSGNLPENSPGTSAAPSFVTPSIPSAVPHKRNERDEDPDETTHMVKRVRLDLPSLHRALIDMYGYDFIKSATYSSTGNGPNGLRSLFSHHSLGLLLNLLGCETFASVEHLQTSWVNCPVSIAEAPNSTAGDVAQALGWKINTLQNRRVTMNKVFALWGRRWSNDLPPELANSFACLQHFLRLTMIRHVPSNPGPTITGSTLNLSPMDLAAKALTLTWLSENVGKIWDSVKGGGRV